MTLLHFDKAALIPRAIRANFPDHHLYVFNKPDYDRAPVDTFLIGCALGTEGKLLTDAAVVVRPRHPERYPSAKLSPEGRMLYQFWQAGCATKQLIDVRRRDYRHVVLPGEPEHTQIAAFKIACDMRRALADGPIEMPATLLCGALGIDFMV